MKCALIALAMLAALPAHAQFRKPEDAVKYRQSVMNVMGTSFYTRLGAMAKDRVPFDAKVAQEHADVVVAMSRLPWIAFAPETNGVGRTDAKPVLWSELPKFRELADQMQAEVLKLQAAARTGNLDAVKAAWRAADKACVNCHDAYTNQ
ncbi:c-type cytochrome [Ramlibacter sp. PS4R-6]|uniref:c-type cytochrome n=1 Tax=Ramlibacter sp. PS4R-6 TaxID=3133438 RepID=UPI0030B11774